MDKINFTGRIVSTNEGSEASLIIPIGEYNIMILSDDSCGEGRGRIVRSLLYIYREKPSVNVNRKVFGQETVAADTDTLFEAMQFCQRQLRKTM